uniref:SEC63 domain-containing protein n=1 Tax=Gongylonema pulchrum TaxID=637853 RepID=A0A183DB16_9BILA
LADLTQKEGAEIAADAEAPQEIKEAEAVQSEQATTSEAEATVEEAEQQPKADGTQPEREQTQEEVQPTKKTEMSEVKQELTVDQSSVMDASPAVAEEESLIAEEESEVAKDNTFELQAAPPAKHSRTSNELSGDATLPDEAKEVVAEQQPDELVHIETTELSEESTTPNKGSRIVHFITRCSTHRWLWLAIDLSLEHIIGHSLIIGLLRADCHSAFQNNFYS